MPPFEIAESVRQVGMPEFSTVVPTSTGSSVLRFLIVSIDVKVNMTHRRGSDSSRWRGNHGWLNLGGGGGAHL